MTEKGPNFLEFAEDIFYSFSHVTHGSLNLIFSKKIMFPIIKYQSKLEISIPLPRKQDDKYLFEGLVFDNTKNDRKNLCCLFLATIYHLAAHACVSRYSKYDSWKKSKTEDVCLRIIDFIEDAYVEKYISQTDPEIWENMKNIDLKFMSQVLKNSNSFNEKNFTIFDEGKKITKLRTSIMNTSNDTMLFANFLYKNRELLPKTILPYCERHDIMAMLNIEQRSPDFEPHGSFKENIMEFEELWSTDEQFKSKMIRKYGKKLKGLNFDAVIIPQGNLHNFLQIREKISPLLRRIRQQIRVMPNLSDESKIDQVGNLNMQMIIQSIASETQFVDVFEQDEVRRSEEAWVILIDNSASMNLQFEQIMEFTVCIAESANYLAGKSDAWALYSFDNNFQILKDFEEKYTREVQARIGSLENNGLSLLPDAIDLTYKMLLDDPRERKYIFVITDGYSSGYDQINQHLSKIIKKIDASGVSLIAIGVSKSTSKRFRNNVRGSYNLERLVTKFITAYKTVSSD